MTQTEAHDPTASASLYPAHPAAQTQLSRNEIETLCLKAARGAGMAWGLAEEAGFAAGWLSAQGIDGAGVLLMHLQNLQPCRISVGDRHWQSASGTELCPITLGAALDDHALLDTGPCSTPLTIAAVRYPLLLVPFLARAACATAQPLRLVWSGGTAVVLANGAVPTGVLADLSRIAVSSLSLTPISDQPPCPVMSPALGALCATTLAGLNVLALRTTVPASDASRRGAGASSSDND